MRTVSRVVGSLKFYLIFSLVFTVSHDRTAVGETSEIGVGPIKKVELQPIDSALAAKGQALFQTKCSACHKLDERYVGPPLAGVTKRRTPEWVMNMIMNPQEMTQKDPAAQELLGEYLTQMASLNLTEPEARSLLEFLRQNDSH
ncbi:MAG: cytochrome c [Oligoflexia bacterium]|nr:cytochrome c [Oligoflexia bacterium]